MSIVVWTEDRVERLKALLDEGLSSSEIAADLGGVTRNAVIGKVHRLGLVKKPKAAFAGSSRSKQAAPRRLTTIAPSYGATRLTRSRKAAPVVEEPAVVEVQAPFECIEEAPAPQAVQLDGLTASNCHWPIGDPRSTDFRFCGGKAVEGKPYCAHHCRVSYQPMSPQRATAIRMSDAERERKAAQGRRIAAVARRFREATV